MKGKYLYCIIKKPNKFSLNLTGVLNEKIKLISADNLAVVVSEIDEAKLVLSRINATAHQQVIEEVFKKQGAVLPISFGTIAKDEDQIKKDLLKENNRVLTDSLNKIENKAQFSIKAMWINFEKELKQAAKEDPNLARIKSKQVGLDQMIDIGKLVTKAIEKKREHFKKLILQNLKGLYERYQEGSLMVDEMIFNLSLLVDYQKSREFDTQMQKIGKEMTDKNIKMKYFGPTAPYDFVKLPIILKEKSSKKHK